MDKPQVLGLSQQMPKGVEADHSYCTLIGHTSGPFPSVVIATQSILNSPTPRVVI